MTGLKRAGTALLAVVLAGGAVASLMAQIPGMPLFTNPRYGTGLRIHADIGKPSKTGDVNSTVYQGGVSLAIGPIGLNVNVGSDKSTVESAQQCVATTTLACASSTATASALAQLRVWGSGRHNLSLSVFGGGSLTLNVGDALASAGSGSATLANNKELHIPVGAALGLHVPLGLGSLNLWGAPRFNLTRYVNCSGTCPTNPKSTFGWAVGADLPIFRVFSIRAAYDSHQVNDGTTTTTVNVIGAGVSFGIGGMR
jgi:hypothetical protein